jgi:hypothetical protein
MGVVRREGPWRLEKEEEGHYSITHEKDTQAKVTTPDYSPGMMDDVSLAAVPVHKVDSSGEAKGVFEEYAEGGGQGGMDLLLGGNTGTEGSKSGGDVELGGSGGGTLDLESPDADLDDGIENIPPGGFAVALSLTGGLVLSVTGFAPDETMFLAGIAFVGVGFVIFAWAGFLFRKRGWDEAAEFLLTTEEEDQSSKPGGKSESSTTKTPPAPEKIKRELIFERAEQECEWCGDFVDNLEVHHIEPRREGGSNDPQNLIVLCPNCHRNADSGGISRNKLRQKIRYIRND